MVKLMTIFIFFSSSVIGGNADLSIELEFNENNGVVYETNGVFVARITNNGPDVAGQDYPFPYPIRLSTGIIQDNGSFTPNVQFAPAPQNDNQTCYFLLAVGDPPPGGSVSYGYSINLNSIDVGETVECFGIFSTHFNSGFREINWSISSSNDVDPISENNAQSVVFGIAPISVPTNNFYSLILLFSLTLLIGFFHYNKNSKI